MTGLIGMATGGTSDSERGLARWRGAALATGGVAGVFAAVVLGILLAGYARGRPQSEFDSAEWRGLKSELTAQPTNDTLRVRLRALDLALRQRFFGWQRFQARGWPLAAAGVAVCLVCLHAARVLARDRPRPGESPQDRRRFLREAFAAQIAVGTSGAAVLALGIGLAALLPDPVAFPPARVAEPGSAGGPIAASAYLERAQAGRNWPRFRGPGGCGISAYTNYPDHWDGATGTGILWKAPIPLPGNSSPVVWGDRVYLTGADSTRREVYAFALDSGALLWQRRVSAGGERPAGGVMEDTGYAAPTPVADGRAVYAVFASGEVAAFDPEGQPLWLCDLGNPENQYGHASSLAVHRDVLLVQFDQGGPDEGKSRLIGIDVGTGRTAWEMPRPVPNSWASPILIETPSGTQLIACGNPWVIAYDPASGREIWQANCLGGDVAPSPVYGSGVVYAVNAGAALAAIRVDGTGDVTATHVLWTAQDDLPDICSPLYAEGLVFLLTTPGLLTCYDGANGQKLWERDLGMSFKASPSLVGRDIYLLSEEGTRLVVEAGRTFAEKRRTTLGEPCRASPAFLDGRILIRAQPHLWCIGSAPAP